MKNSSSYYFIAHIDTHKDTHRHILCLVSVRLSFFLLSTGAVLIDIDFILAGWMSLDIGRITSEMITNRFRHFNRNAPACLPFFFLFFFFYLLFIIFYMLCISVCSIGNRRPHSRKAEYVNQPVTDSKAINRRVHHHRGLKAGLTVIAEVFWKIEL